MTDVYEWAGSVGDTWAAEWRVTDRTFTGINLALVDAARELLAGTNSPRILEIGCGAGTTSFSLAEAIPSASILGVDISPALIAVARERAAGRAACRFVVGDASTWDAEGDFDLIASRHGVMFFDDPVAAFTAIRSRARAGGKLLFSCFRDAADNPWSWIGADAPPPPSEAPGPFAFADQDHVAAVLAAAGWHDAAPEPVDTSYHAGDGPDAVAQAQALFARIGPAAAARRRATPDEAALITTRVDRRIQEANVGEQVTFPTAVWLWRARA